MNNLCIFSPANSTKYVPYRKSKNVNIIFIGVNVSISLFTVSVKGCMVAELEVSEADGHPSLSTLCLLAVTD
jgi:hypothetical protein